MLRWIRILGRLCGDLQGVKHDDLTLYLPVGGLIVGAIRCGATEDGRLRRGLVNLEKGFERQNSIKTRDCFLK